MWLKRLFKNKKAQSTAEYGILFAAIIAIAAGALTIALRGAIQTKNEKAQEFLLRAGTNVLQEAVDGGEFPQDVATIVATTEEVRRTENLAAGFRDETVRLKTGAEKKAQTQHTVTDQVSITKIISGAAVAPSP